MDLHAFDVTAAIGDEPHFGQSDEPIVGRVSLGREADAVDNSSRISNRMKRTPWPDTLSVCTGALAAAASQTEAAEVYRKGIGIARGRAKDVEFLGPASRQVAGTWPSL